MRANSGYGAHAQVPLQRDYLCWRISSSCSPEPSPIDQLDNLSFAIALADKAEMCRREFPLAVNKKVVGSESIPPYCSETRLLSIMTA
jgi:hypothetical protein